MAVRNSRKKLPRPGTSAPFFDCSSRELGIVCWVHWARGRFARVPSSVGEPACLQIPHHGTTNSGGPSVNPGGPRQGASMARMRSLEREDLAAEHRHIYDNIAASRGRVQPNFKVLLNNPLATASMAALGGYVRFEAPLPPRIKMLAVLATAREVDGDY